MVNDINKIEHFEKMLFPHQFYIISWFILDGKQKFPNAKEIRMSVLAR